MELTEFLLARIAEDEAWLAVPTTKRMVARRVVELPMTRLPDYVRRDRDRWAAECDAKRRIVAVIEAHREGEWEGDPIHANLLKVMASIYSDHPDFDPAWA